MSWKSFEDVEAWRQARALTNAVYDVTEQRPFSRDFGLSNQIQRACVSAMSNIAEGFERGGTREFLRFLRVSKASLAEVRSDLYVALDRRYIDRETFARLQQMALSTSRLVGGLIAYLLRSLSKKRDGPGFS